MYEIIGDKHKSFNQNFIKYFHKYTKIQKFTNNSYINWKENNIEVNKLYKTLLNNVELK